MVQIDLLGTRNLSVSNLMDIGLMLDRRNNDLIELN